MAQFDTRGNFSAKSSKAKTIPSRTSADPPSKTLVKRSSTPYSPLEAYNAAHPEHTMDAQVDFIKRDDDNYLRILKKQLANVLAEVDAVERLIKESDSSKSKYSLREVSDQRAFRGNIGDFRGKVNLLRENITDMQHEHYSIGASADEILPSPALSPKRSIGGIWSSTPDAPARVFAGWKRKVRAMSLEQIERERTNLKLRATRDNVSLTAEVTKMDRLVKDLEFRLQGSRQKPEGEMQQTGEK